MSKLTKEELMLLMAHADVELTGDERLRAISLLESHPDAVSVLGATFQMGEEVRAIASAQMGTFDIADDIMAKIEGEQKGATVLPFASKRLRAAGGVVAAFAMAASVAFFMERKGADTVGPVASLTAVATAAAGAEAQGVEVESVEAPNGVSVFYLPSALNANASSVVLWVEDGVGGEKP